MKHATQGAPPLRPALAILAILVFVGPALSDEPALVVHAEGAYLSYPITEITRIEFVNDTLVVETPGSIDSYPLWTIQKLDFSSIMTAVQSPEVVAALPGILNLFPNQPNPLSTETRIAFRLPEAVHVELKIYEVSGRLVRTLVSGDQEAGSHTAVWDGLDEAGRRVAAGIYFYRLAAPGIKESRRMILLP
jgi:hypothetical protein